MATCSKGAPATTTARSCRSRRDYHYDPLILATGEETCVHEREEQAKRELLEAKEKYKTLFFSVGRRRKAEARQRANRQTFTLYSWYV